MWRELAIVMAGIASVLPAIGADDVRGVNKSPQGALCLQALATVKAGSVLDDANFAAVKCPEGRIPVFFHFNLTRGENHAVRDISAGCVVRRYVGFGERTVRAGQKLVLISSAGTVRVERSVTAIQMAREGQHLFVVAPDGHTISVVYRGDKP